MLTTGRENWIRVSVWCECVIQHPDGQQCGCRMSEVIALSGARVWLSVMVKHFAHNIMRESLQQTILCVCTLVPHESDRYDCGVACGSQITAACCLLFERKSCSLSQMLKIC